MISENSLELLEYPKLLGIIAEPVHCPATREAVLAIRPYESLTDILQRQRLVEELRRLSAEGAPVQIFTFADLKPSFGKGSACRGGPGSFGAFHFYARPAIILGHSRANQGS